MLKAQSEAVNFHLKLFIDVFDCQFLQFPVLSYEPQMIYPDYLCELCSLMKDHYLQSCFVSTSLSCPVEITTCMVWVLLPLIEDSPTQPTMVPNFKHKPPAFFSSAISSSLWALRNNLEALLIGAVYSIRGVCAPHPPSRSSALGSGTNSAALHSPQWKGHPDVSCLLLSLHFILCIFCTQWILQYPVSLSTICL